MSHLAATRPLPRKRWMSRIICGSPQTALVATWILGLHGCGIVELSVPGDGARSVVIIIDADGETPRVFATEPSSVPIHLSYAPSADQGRDLRLYTLGYECSLDAIGLVSGWLDVSQDGNGRTLPPPARVLVSTLMENARTEWESISELPGFLNALRLALPERGPRCARLGVNRAILDDTRGKKVTFAIAFEADGAFVGLNDGRFFHVTRDGASPLLGIPPETPSHAAFRSLDGTYWLLGLDGRLARGHPLGSFEIVATSSIGPGARSVWIDGTSDIRAPFELFRLSDESSFARFDGSAWQLIDRRPRSIDEKRGDVAWMSRDEAIAVGPGSSSVLHFQNGRVTEEALPDVLRGDQPISAEQTSSYGTLVGTKGGILFQRKDGVWRPLLSEPESFDIFVIEGFGDGILFGGAEGVLTEYGPAGTCPPEIYAPRAVRKLESIDGGFVLVPERKDEEDLEILLLTRGSEAPSGCAP